MHPYDVSTQLEKVLKHKALGYEDSITFAHGYLLALKQANLITTKDYSNLILVHASPVHSTDIYFFIDETGTLQHHWD